VAALGFANNQASIGTKVIINPGTYREAITLQPLSTTTSLPMTFEAATNGTVIVSGADVWKGWQTYSKNSSIYTQAWPYQWGLCEVDSGIPPFEENIVLRREMIVVNGTPLTQVLALSAMVVSTFYVDEKGGTAYLWPPAGTNMSSATVEVSTRPELFMLVGMSNIVLRGLTFQYAGSCYRDEAVGTTTGTTNVLFDTDTFNWNNGSGLFIAQTTYVTVQNSVADHNGRNGTADLRTKYGLYQNDTASYNNWRGAQGVYYGWGNAGAHFVEDHDDSIEGFNLLFNETFGTHWDTDNANIVASGLIASENLAAAAFVEKSQGPVSISHSYMCNGNPAIGAATVGFELRNSEQVTLTSDVIANNVENLLVEGTAGGIQVTNWETGQVYNLISQNFTATSNTFANAGGDTLVLDGYLGGTDWTTFQSSLASDYNTWWNGSQTNPYTVPVPTNYYVTNFAGWQAQTAQDQHSAFQSPSSNYDAACLVTPVGSDFWFTTGSKTGLRTVSPGSSATVKAVVTPLGFSGTVNLSSDGVQNIPGATASWSPTSITAPGNSTFTVTAAKTTPAGNYPITLVANSGNLTRTMTASLLVNTSLAIVPSNLLFSSQYVGTTSAPLLVNIVNAGSAAVNFTSLSASGPFTQTNNCGTSLGAGGTCEVTITFTPTGPGTLTGTLAITDADPMSPQKVVLTGIGSAVPVAELVPSSLSFGNQPVGTSSKPLNVTLTNNGSSSLGINSITVSGPSFSVTNKCGSWVPVGGSCTISVTFTPLGSGSMTGIVYVKDTAVPPTQMISLSGTGTQPKVSLSTAYVAFGNQKVGTSSAPQTVTMTNTGTATLTISSIALGGTDPQDFTQSNTCGSSLAVGASCTITGTFTPTTNGQRSASILVTANVNNSPVTITITGYGTL
jgi:hypothetical protein